MADGTPDQLKISNQQLTVEPKLPVIPNSSESGTPDQLKLYAEPTSEGNAAKGNIVFPQPSTDIGKFGEFTNISEEDFGLQTGMNQEENRALHQNTAAKWSNGFVKMIGTASTSFAEPFVDMTYGLGRALISPITSNREDGFSSIWDNELTQKFDQLNEYLREEFPNYYTQAERNASLLEGLGQANFWADKVGNGLGFMAGAIASGYLTGGLGIGRSAATKMAQAFGNFSKASDYGKILGLEKLGTEALNVLANKAKLDKIKQSSDIFTSGLFASIGESGIEARQTHELTTNFFLNKRSELYEAANNGKQDFTTNEQHIMNMSDDDINDVASANSNVAFSLNLAVVGSTNMIQFGRLFAKGFKGERKALQQTLSERVGKEGGKYFVKPITTTGKILNVVRNPASEATQEQLQHSIQKGIESYNVNHESNAGFLQSVNDMIEATSQGLEEAYGTKEGLEQGLLGAIIGGIGGGVNYAITKKDKASNEFALTNTVDLLNKYKLSDSFKPLHDAAVLSAKSRATMDQSVKNDDIFGYKNAEADNVFSYMNSRITTGQYERLIDELESVKGLSEQQFKETFKFEDGQPLDKSVYETVDALIKKAKTINEINENIEHSFNGVDSTTKGYLKNVAYRLEDNDKREKELSLKLFGLTNGALTFNAIRFKESTKWHPKDEEVGENEYNYNDEFNKQYEEWKKTNPVNAKEVVEVVQDLAKLVSQREGFIEAFNYLSTKKGQDRVSKEIVDNAKKKEEKEIKDFTDKFNQDLKDNPKTADELQIIADQELVLARKKIIQDKVNLLQVEKEKADQAAKVKAEKEAIDLKAKEEKEAAELQRKKEEKDKEDQKKKEAELKKAEQKKKEPKSSVSTKGLNSIALSQIATFKNILSNIETIEEKKKFLNNTKENLRKNRKHHGF